MERWAARVLQRVRESASRGAVSFTYKALQELAHIGLDEIDCCEILAGLTSKDCERRLRSTRTGEWMYVFRALHVGNLVYIKLVVRRICIVVSFHEEVDDLGETRDRS